METPTTETRDALADRVVQLAAKQVEIPPEQVALDARFIEDLGYDSLDLVEFTMEIEEAFDLTVPDDVAQKITTVRQAIEQIRRLAGPQERME